MHPADTTLRGMKDQHSSAAPNFRTFDQIVRRAFDVVEYNEASLHARLFWAGVLNRPFNWIELGAFEGEFILCLQHEKFGEEPIKIKFDVFNKTRQEVLDEVTARLMMLL